MKEELAKRLMMINRVKQLRATGLTVSEMAKRLNIPESYVRSITQSIDDEYTKMGLYFKTE